MAVRCCSAQVDPSSGGIQLDLGPELLQEGMRLQLHAFTREAARDEVSGTSPLLPPSAVRIPRLAASSRVLSIPAENGIFEPFLYKMHHFTKTGSGQT